VPAHPRPRQHRGPDRKHAADRVPGELATLAVPQTVPEHPPVARAAPRLANVEDLELELESLAHLTNVGLTGAALGVTAMGKPRRGDDRRAFLRYVLGELEDRDEAALVASEVLALGQLSQDPLLDLCGLTEVVVAKPHAPVKLLERAQVGRRSRCELTLAPAHEPVVVGDRRDVSEVGTQRDIPRRRSLVDRSARGFVGARARGRGGLSRRVGP
jgi:hypothetical protein